MKTTKTIVESEVNSEGFFEVCKISDFEQRFCEKNCIQEKLNVYNQN